MTLAIDSARARLNPVGWVLSCALAEGIGMSASAAAARASDSLPDLVALALIVAGGLVEGTALGVLQARWLSRRFPGVSQIAWVVTTVVIAGIGWSIAAAPAALTAPGGGSPPELLIIIGAAGMGATMGSVMGLAQALVLRGHVRHPWRWVSISAAAWTPSMIVIFIGATLPDESWHIMAVIALGLVTGLVAGGALGFVSSLLMRTLSAQSVWSPILTWLMQHEFLGVGRWILQLRITGVKSGRLIELPVQYARDNQMLVVYPAGAAHKTWWRNLVDPHPLSIWIDGGWRAARGHVVPPEAGEAAMVRSLYLRRWPRINVPLGVPLVRIDLDQETPSRDVAWEAAR